MKILVMVAALFLAGPVAAGAAEPVPLTVQLDAAVCRQVVRHVPAPDVSYRPGVDVHGRRVAPADLAGTPQPDLSGPFLVEVTVDVARRLGLPLDIDRFQSEIQVGLVTVDGDRLFFNGQPITPQIEDAVAVLCRASERPLPRPVGKGDG